MSGFINTSRFQMNLMKFNYNQGDSNMKFLKLPQVMSVTSMSRSSIYLAISTGKFPKQISLGARSVAWVESDILSWMEECIANRG